MLLSCLRRLRVEVTDVVVFGVFVQAGEEDIFLFRLDDDRWADQDQQSTLVLCVGRLGEEAVDDWDLGEDGDADLGLDLADKSLASDE